MSIILPDPRLEMPALLYPGRKPAGGVVINRDHWAGRHVNFCVVNSQGMPLDLVTGTVGTGNAVPYIIREGNRFLDYASASTRTDIDVGAVLFGSTPWTLHVKFKFDTDNKALFSLQTDPAVAAKGFVIYYSDSGAYADYSFGAAHSNMNNRRVSFASSARAVNDLILVNDGVSNANTLCYVNGVLETNTSTGTLSNNTNGTTLGGRRNGDIAGSSSIEFLNVFSGWQASKSEALSLYNDPYQILVPA